MIDKKYNIWVWVITILTASLLFLPFLVSNSLFFPFVSGKGFAFRIIAEIIFAVWLIGCLYNPSLRPKKNIGIFILLGLIISLLISAILGPDTQKSIWSNYERMEGWMTLLHVFMLVVATAYSIPKKMWHNILNISLFASFLVSGYGLLQLMGKITINQGGVRLDGPFGNSAYFAVYLLIHIFLALFFVFRTRINELKAVYGTLAFILAFLLYHTATRGAMLGLIAGLIVALAIYAIFERRKKLLIAAISSILVIVFGVALFIGVKDSNFVMNSPVLSRFATISLNETTTASRFMVWNMAWQGFKEKPIFGWGQENFNYVFNKYYDPNMYAQEQWFDRAHNVFFDWLTTGGILGALLYFGFFGYMVWVILRGLFKKETENGFEKTELAFLVGLLVAYFVHNLFVFDSVFSYVLLAVLSGFILRLDLETKEIVEETPKQLEKPVINAIVVSVAFALMFAIYTVNYKPLKANTLLIDSYPKQDKDFRPELMKEAIALKTFGTTEIREQLAQITTNRMNSGGGNITPKLQEEYAFARAETMNEVSRVPHNARTLAMASIVLRAGGEMTVAENFIKRALEESSKKQTIFFEYGNVLLMQNKNGEALDKFRIAYELAPKYEEALVTYFIASLIAGEIDTAKDLYTKISQERLTSDDRLNNFLERYGWYKEFLVNTQGMVVRREEKMKELDQKLSDARESMKTEKRRSKINKLDKTITSLESDRLALNQSLLKAYASLTVAYLRNNKIKEANAQLSKMETLGIASKEEINEWYTSVKTK